MKHDNTAVITATTVGLLFGTSILAWLAYKKWYSHKSYRPSKPFLIDKQDSKTVKLISKKALTHDVRLFRFQFPQSDQTLGILAGEHVKLSAEVSSKHLVRFYSPISEPHQEGYFEIIMKIYSPTPESPTRGAFSTYMDSLSLGSEVRISGPFGRFGYLSGGAFLVNAKSIMKYKAIAMVSGGSGLTPMLPIIRRIVKEPHGPKLSLVYSNKTEEDVIQSDELKHYAHNHDNFKLTLVYTRLLKDAQDREDPIKWIEHFNRLDEQLITRVFPEPHDKILVLICGPKGMNDAAKMICTKLSYPNIHVF